VASTLPSSTSLRPMPTPIDSLAKRLASFQLPTALTTSVNRFELPFHSPFSHTLKKGFYFCKTYRKQTHSLPASSTVSCPLSEFLKLFLNCADSNDFYYNHFWCVQLREMKVRHDTFRRDKCSFLHPDDNWSRFPPTPPTWFSSPARCSLQ
jgi:hypothetical protein